MKKCALIVIALFCLSSVCWGDELSEVNQSIESHGAKWKAKDNPISNLSPEQRKMRLGTVPEVLGEPITIDVSAPSEWDWSQYVTSVKDQGACGSCWAFSAAGVLESKVLMADTTISDIDLSEQVLLSCSHSGSCSGGVVSYASDYIRDTGIPVESCYEYLAENGLCEDACADRLDNSYRIRQWYSVPWDLEGLKNALYVHGPLSVSFLVYSDFFFYDSGIYSYTSGTLQGAHAVVLVGYNDAEQYFLCKNSWNTTWGEDGWFRIAYSEVTGASRFGNSTRAYGEAILPEPPPPPVPFCGDGVCNADETCESCQQDCGPCPPPPEPNIPPVADFTFSQVKRQIRFSNLSTDSDGTIVSYLWNFGDGKTGGARNPHHVYRRSGDYSVTLTVVDNNGAWGSITKTVSVTVKKK